MAGVQPEDRWISRRDFEDIYKLTPSPEAIGFTIYGGCEILHYTFTDGGDAALDIAELERMYSL